MIKSKLRLFGWAVGLSLALGAVGAVAAQGAPVETKATEVTDTLTADLFEATDTGYVDFSGVAGSESDAVYAGNNGKTSAGGIQLRSKNSNSGIVSTTSGGKLKSVSIVVESGSNRVDVYGSNDAYTSASNLYGSSKGTLIGSTTSSGTITVPANGDYDFVGIRSSNGALYLTSIDIVWDAASSATPVISNFIGTYGTNYILPTQTGTLAYTWSGTPPTVKSVAWSSDNEALEFTNASTGAFQASSSITAKTEVNVSLTVTDTNNEPHVALSKKFYVCPHALDTSKNLKVNSPKTSFTLDDQFAIVASGSTAVKATFLDQGEVDVLDDLQGGALSIIIGGKPFNIGDYLLKAQDGANVTISYTYGGRTQTVSSPYSITVANKAAPVDPPTTAGWNLVTDASTLSAGDKVLIAASEYDYALSTVQNTNNRGQDDISKDGGSLSSVGASVQELTLEVGTTAGTFSFSTGSGYLYAASSGSNYLRTEENKTANSSFTIGITNAGVATITAQGNNTRNLLQYNNSNSIFSCYGSAQKSVSIYRFAAPSLVDYLQYWANHNLHFQDVAEHDGSDGTACLGYYEPAKAALKDLNDEHSGVIGKLETGTEDSIVKFRNRYEAWARANHDTAPYDGSATITKAAVVFKGVTDNARTPLLVAAFAGVGALAVGGMVFLRKRKEL